MYAGHDGNVYKNTGSGWKSYDNGSWNSVQGSQKSAPERSQSYNRSSGTNQAAAQQILTDLRQSRWVLIARAEHVIPIPFLVVLLFWLTMLHISFGLFAPLNGTVITVLFISALSVSGAIFIVLDMTHPLQGVITVSSAPMRKALEQLAQ